MVKTIYNPNYNFATESERIANQENIDAILSDKNWRRNSMVAKKTLMALLAQPETIKIEREVSLVSDHRGWKSDFKVYTTEKIIISEANGWQHHYHSDLCPSNEEFLNSSYRSWTKDLTADIKGYGRLNINLLVPYIRVKEPEKTLQELALTEAMKSSEFRIAFLAAMNSNEQVNFNIRQKGKMILPPRKIIESQLDVDQIAKYVSEDIDLSSSIDLTNDFLNNCVFDRKNEYLYEKE